MKLWGNVKDSANDSKCEPVSPETQAEYELIRGRMGVDDMKWWLQEGRRMLKVNPKMTRKDWLAVGRKYVEDVQGSI